MLSPKSLLHQTSSSVLKAGHNSCPKWPQEQNSVCSPVGLHGLPRAFPVHLQVESFAMFVFINVSRSPQSPYVCASPCPLPQAGIWDTEPLSPPSDGAACTSLNGSWGRSIPVLMDTFLLFCRANSNLSNSLYSSLHRVKLEGLIYCLIWINLAVFKAEKKQTLQLLLLLLLLLPQCHSCINSLSFLSWLMTHPTMRLWLSANMTKFQKQNHNLSWVARSGWEFI